MGERQDNNKVADPLEDIFEPALSDLLEEDLDLSTPASLDQQRLAQKRRRAEELLEQKRLRDELGDYDFKFDHD